MSVNEPKLTYRLARQIHTVSVSDIPTRNEEKQMARLRQENIVLKRQNKIMEQ